MNFAGATQYKPFLISSVILISLVSSKALATGLSPFSPTFVLEEGRIVSSTGLAYWDTSTKSKLNSVPTANDVRVGAVSANQSLRVGLANDIELGLGIGYSDAVRRSPSTVVTNDGFTNPSIWISKVWKADAQIRGGFSVTPRTNSNGAPNTPTVFNLGGSVTKIYSDDWMAGLGISRSIYERDRDYDKSTGFTDFTTISAGLTKPVGTYLITGAITATMRDRKEIGVGTATATSLPSTGYAYGLTVSHPIRTATWVGVTYTHSRTESEGRAENLGVTTTSESKGRSNSLQASIQIIF